MELEEANKKRLLGLKASETSDFLPPEGARIHFAAKESEVAEACQQLYTFYSKPFGSYGDWYMQQCNLSTSSENPELEPWSDFGELSSLGCSSIPNDFVTKDFADKSKGMFYYHLVGSDLSKD